MNGTSMEPVEPEAAETAPSGRSSYEDYDVSALTSGASHAPAGRNPTITVAGVVMTLSGALPLLAVPLFKPERTAAIGLIVLGVAELAGALLVLTLRPVGRPFGIALGALGLVLGIVTARSSPTNGIITMALNGYVIYALASSGPAFRRR